MKTIIVDKGGYGSFSLFSEESNSKELIQDTRLEGKYLDEIGLSFNVDDILLIKTPSKRFKNTFTLSKVRIYEITNELYRGEFI